MKTAEEIVKGFNEALDHFKKISPDAPVSKMGYLDIRAVKAAMRIREVMLNYPIGNLRGDDFTHPTKWDEQTILMMTGAIMSQYPTEKASFAG